MYVLIHMYVNEPAGFGTRITQHICVQYTDGRVIFNFIYRCRNNTFLLYCDAEVFSCCRMRAISIMAVILSEWKEYQMRDIKFVHFCFMLP
jgi:hypothetical protein